VAKKRDREKWKNKKTRNIAQLQLYYSEKSQNYLQKEYKRWI